MFFRELGNPEYFIFMQYFCFGVISFYILVKLFCRLDLFGNQWQILIGDDVEKAKGWLTSESKTVKSIKFFCFQKDESNLLDNDCNRLQLNFLNAFKPMIANVVIQVLNVLVLHEDIIFCRSGNGRLGLQHCSPHRPYRMTSHSKRPDPRRGGSCAHCSRLTHSSKILFKRLNSL